MRRPLATPEEVSEHLRVPLDTLYAWRYRGTGPKASKVGKHLRYDWADVEKWLEAQAAKT